MDDAIGSGFEEEIDERLLQHRGVGSDCGGHGGVGYVVVDAVWEVEGVDGDWEAGLSVTEDGILEAERVLCGGDDCGDGAVGCKHSGHVYEGNLVASSYKGEEKHFYRR